RPRAPPLTSAPKPCATGPRTGVPRRRARRAVRGTDFSGKGGIRGGTASRAVDDRGGPHADARGGGGRRARAPGGRPRPPRADRGPARTSRRARLGPGSDGLARRPRRARVRVLALYRQDAALARHDEAPDLPRAGGDDPRGRRDDVPREDLRPPDLRRRPPR